ncbi:hypothetical protein E2C01_019410 [Portunus trituberculatus]|uniref:Uncharacterized protein n=1 Tax=Portunus trituberculatus TaxID=210409 RepID=A0A5B7E0C4_PORTR|nr:hypothetical protein [Portunus trituberculatus]
MAITCRQPSAGKYTGRIVAVESRRLTGRAPPLLVFTLIKNLLDEDHKSTLLDVYTGRCLDQGRAALPCPPSEGRNQASYCRLKTVADWFSKKESETNMPYIPCFKPKCRLKTVSDWYSTKKNL